MKRCPRCGTENDETNNFCSSCGLNLPGTPSPATSPHREETPSDPHMGEPKPRSRGRTVVLAIIAVLLLGCVGFFVWALTPAGQGQMSEFATWAAREATRQSAS